MATRLDVITRALQSIGVVAEDEPATAEQYANADAVLTGILAEAQVDGLTGLSPVEPDFPDRSSDALARYLGATIAPDFGLQSPVSRAAAARRFWASVRVDNRTAVVTRDDAFF